MRRFLPFALVACVGVGALVSGTLLYRAKMPVVPTLTKEQSILAMNGAESAHIRGERDAAVTVEEFGDFQCPPCADLSDVVNQLVKDYRGRVRIIFREFPLTTHAHAHQAALAAEAAGLQDRFWQMHDLIYREQSTWSHEADVRSFFESFAGTLGLDLERYKKDRDSDQVQARVTDDEKRAVKLGVTNTPTIFVNGIEVPRDSLRPDRLRAYVDQVVKSTPAH